MTDSSQYDFFFDPDQVWTPINGELDFIDEGLEVGNAYVQCALEEDAKQIATPANSNSRDRQPHAFAGPLETSGYHTPSSMVGSPGPVMTPAMSAFNTEQVPPTDQRFMEGHEPTENESDFRNIQDHDQEEVVLAPNGLDLFAKPNIPQELAYSHPLIDCEPNCDQWEPNAQHNHNLYTSKLPNTPNNGNLGSPLESINEFQLLQHFISHLGFWFDVGDSMQHFTKSAPSMAASSPMLMNAILALSALHLSRVSEYYPCEPVRYHNKCIQLMVPMLNNVDPIKDDNFLMTTVILSLYEDFDVGGDSRRHLIGTSLALPASGTCLSSQLRRAVFWVHLRQEIYHACAQQCTIRANLENCTFDSSLDSVDDCIWLHRALWVCALVIQWAFGDDLSRSRWRELHQLVEEWQGRRPKSYNPLFFRPSDPDNERWFPEVCYATDEHVTGVHFIYLAKLLLATHDPTIPRIGSRVKLATAKMQGTALSYVRILCGIALCNSFIPARFTATLGIIVCGSWFKRRPEQEALIAFMSRTEKCSGWIWPSQQPQQTLMEDWGWE